MRNTPSMRGYTLLELIVSIGIFSLVMLTATGAYIKLIDLDRQARGTNDVVSNLSFAVDSMARAVRTGTGYRCNKTGTTCFDINNPGTSIQFTDEQGRTVVYELDATTRQVRQTITPVSGQAYSAYLTDPRITVTQLNFFVRGVGIESSGQPKIQPQVTFLIAGSMVTGPGKTVTFSIEGSATQRVLELP